MDMDGTHSLTIVRIQELSLIQKWNAEPDNIECGNKRNLSAIFELKSQYPFPLA